MSLDELILIDTSNVSNSPEIGIFEGNCLLALIDIPLGQIFCNSLSIQIQVALSIVKIKEEVPPLSTLEEKRVPLATTNCPR